MKLKEFNDRIQDLIKKNPELLEVDVVFAKDDEGNGFNHVNYSATPGNFEDHEFTGEGDSTCGKINAICIN